MELALAFPYSLGVVAAFNPCGFALLPAYLSYFVGLEAVVAARADRQSRAVSGQAEDTDADRADTDTAHTRTAGIGYKSRLLSAVLRGITVGLTLTAGFVSVFGVFGVLFETILNQGAVLDRIGYATIFVGLVMLGLGMVMLMGKEINLRLPKINRGTSGRSMASVFMFGVSYAVVSLSCTIGLFLAGVASAFTDSGFVDGVANFVAYGMGMGSVITFLTLALVLACDNVVGIMRKARRWVNPVSGFTLMAAGVYLVNYGWWELRLRDDPTARNVLVDWFARFQADVSNWISQVTPLRLGVVCVVCVAGVISMAWWRTATAASVRNRMTGDGGDPGADSLSGIADTRDDTPTGG